MFYCATTYLYVSPMFNKYFSICSIILLRNRSFNGVLLKKCLSDFSKEILQLPQ